SGRNGSLPSSPAETCRAHYTAAEKDEAARLRCGYRSEIRGEGEVIAAEGPDVAGLGPRRKQRAEISTVVVKDEGAGRIRVCEDRADVVLFAIPRIIGPGDADEQGVLLTVGQADAAGVEGVLHEGGAGRSGHVAAGVQGSPGDVGAVPCGHERLERRRRPCQ